MLGPAIAALILASAQAAPGFGIPEDARFAFQKSSATAVAWDVSPTAREFLKENGSDFKRFHASFGSMDEVPADFSEMTDQWRVKGELDEVFGRFLASSPLAWNGTAAFELLYDPRSEAVYDRGAKVLPAPAEGQIVLLTIKLVAGVKLPVAFQFVRIDEKQHEVSFSYLSVNTSAGVQRARFAQKGDEVVVTHVSRFKSESHFRDARLYPFFHRRLLDDYYGRVLAPRD